LNPPGKKGEIGFRGNWSNAVECRRLLAAGCVTRSCEVSPLRIRILSQTPRYTQEPPAVYQPGDTRSVSKCYCTAGTQKHLENHIFTSLVYRRYLYMRKRHLSIQDGTVKRMGEVKTKTMQLSKIIEGNCDSHNTAKRFSWKTEPSRKGMRKHCQRM